MEGQREGWRAGGKDEGMEGWRDGGKDVGMMLGKVCTGPLPGWRDGGNEKEGFERSNQLANASNTWQLMGVSANMGES